MALTVEQAQAAVASAKTAYLEELRQDSERSGGSDAQERRREEHQESLRNRVWQCERDFEDAKRRANLMEPLLIIKPSVLCNILSKQKGELTEMELAVREAMEKANSSAELDVLRQRSCLSDAIGEISVTKSGKVLKI